MFIRINACFAGASSLNYRSYKVQFLQPKSGHYALIHIPHPMQCYQLQQRFEPHGVGIEALKPYCSKLQGVKVENKIQLAGAYPPTWCWGISCIVMTHTALKSKYKRLRVRHWLWWHSVIGLEKEEIQRYALIGYLVWYFKRTLPLMQCNKKSERKVQNLYSLQLFTSKAKLTKVLTSKKDKP